MWGTNLVQKKDNNIINTNIVEYIIKRLIKEIKWKYIQSNDDMMMMMISKIKTVNKSEKYLPYKNAEPANFHSLLLAR